MEGEQRKQIDAMNELEGRFVYMIRCGAFYKIGVATDLVSRFSSIQSSNPHELKLISFFKTIHCFGAEQFIHERLYKYHVRGEWFKLNTKQAEKVEALFIKGI